MNKNNLISKILQLKMNNFKINNNMIKKFHNIRIKNKRFKINENNMIKKEIWKKVNNKIFMMKIQQDSIELNIIKIYILQLAIMKKSKWNFPLNINKKIKILTISIKKNKVMTIKMNINRFKIKKFSNNLKIIMISHNISK